MRNILSLIKYLFFIPLSALLLLVYTSMVTPCENFMECETPDTPLNLFVLFIYVLFNIAIIFRISKIAFRFFKKRASNYK